ncbi:hypothetical protein ACFSTC_08635 [Nonomuraea ferruginea]
MFAAVMAGAVLAWLRLGGGDDTPVAVEKVTVTTSEKTLGCDSDAFVSGRIDTNGGAERDPLRVADEPRQGRRGGHPARHGRHHLLRRRPDVAAPGRAHRQGHGHVTGALSRSGPHREDDLHLQVLNAHQSGCLLR